METITLLQHYWWLIISLLGALLVFLLFVQGGQGLLYCLGRTEEERNMLDEKDLKMIDEIFAHRLNVVMESAITPKLNLLAEGQQTLLETLAPKSRVEELEEEVDFLKSIVKLHSQQIAELKKAQ